jgi:hypothetical protein
MTEIFSLKAISAAITSFWARSAILLWCLAGSCFFVLVALMAGAHWQLGDTPALLAAYGTILGLALLVLLVFAAFKTYSERPKPILSLLPQEDQSFWGQSRQTDGRITTQLSLRFQATNLTDGAIMLSAVELRRPFVRRRAILTKMISFAIQRGTSIVQNTLSNPTLLPMDRRTSLSPAPLAASAKRCGRLLPCKIMRAVGISSFFHTCG